MPRPKKILTPEEIDEKVAEIDARIQKCQNLIAELKKRKKELADEKDTAEYQRLMEEIRRTGKTPEEVMNLLQPPENSQ